MNVRLQSPLDTDPFHQWVFPDGVLWAAFHRNDCGYLLRFPELADFTVSADGRTVACHPVPNVPQETSEHLYLNQVLPLALSIQGKLVFHGSAVEVADAAVAFVAESGRGKSTLAAEFACNGFRFLTDDGLVVEPRSKGYEIKPSHPSIRLWSDSEEALIAQGTTTAPSLPFTSKSRFLAGPDIAFCNKSRSLRRVYFLGDGNVSELTIQSMTGAESLVEYVRHSFLLDIKKKPLLASHFEKVAKLANQQIHFRLDYPRKFEELESIRQAIVEHISDKNASLNLQLC